MKVCPECKQNIEDQYNFCPECGAKLGTDRKWAEDTPPPQRYAPENRSLDAMETPSRQPALAVSLNEGGMSEAKEMVESEEEMESAEGILLAINANKALFKDTMGNIDFQVANNGRSAIENLELELSCESTDRTLRPAKHRKLSPGRKEESPFSIHLKPQEAGEDLLHIKFSFFDGQKNYKCYLGNAKLNIFDKEEFKSGGGPGNNISIVIQDIDKMMGVDLSQLVTVQEKESKVKEIMQQRRSDSFWMKVNLYLDYDEMQKWKEIESSKATTRIKFIYAEKTSQTMLSAQLASASPEHRHVVKLFSKPEIRFGRQRVDETTNVISNEVVLRVQPSSPENDNLSRRISRKQFVIKYQKGSFFLKDVSATWGTVVNKQRVEQAKELLLAGDDEIYPGIENFRFKFLLFKDTTGVANRPINNPAVENWRRENAALCNQFGFNMLAAVEAAKIIRLDNWTHEEYCILVKEAKIGRSHRNCIVIEDPSVSEIHARIMFSNGQYFLEDLNSEQGTFVDAVKLMSNEVALLNYGMEIRLGKVAYKFEALD